MMFCVKCIKSSSLAWMAEGDFADVLSMSDHCELSLMATHSLFDLSMAIRT